MLGEEDLPLYAYAWQPTGWAGRRIKLKKGRRRRRQEPRMRKKNLKKKLRSSNPFQILVEGPWERVVTILMALKRELNKSNIHWKVWKYLMLSWTVVDPPSPLIK